MSPFKPYRPSRGLAFSILLHLALPLFLSGMPLFFKRAFVENPGARKVYEIKMVDLSAYLPSLRTPRPAGSPGQGIRPERPPARGSTHFHPRSTIVSAPPAPDNDRQTILQPAAPPKLRIPFEVRLPNLVLKSNPALPKPPLPNPEVTIRRQEAPVPQLPPAPAELRLTAQAHPIIPLPNLEVPAPPPPPAETAAQEGSTEGTAGGSPTGDNLELLALSVDPAPGGGKISVPLGNRYGAFSVSPVLGPPGSPGGVAGGDPQGGRGGSGSGGEGGTGSAPGGTGGGGQSAGEGFVSISGSGGIPGVSGVEGFNAAAIASLVYPVRPLPGPRRPAMVVMAGPSGGGGLDVYGVLRGGRVYTISLPMPGKNWVLQYCYHENSSDGTNHESRPARGTSIQLPPSVVSPYAEERFDFSRAFIPQDKAHQMIVLHGVIQSDGSVANLKILRGLQEVADQAALSAFRRWKFKPATRAGQPVTVEVLVGIPAKVPAI